MKEFTTIGMVLFLGCCWRLFYITSGSEHLATIETGIVVLATLLIGLVMFLFATIVDWFNERK